MWQAALPLRIEAYADVASMCCAGPGFPPSLSNADFSLIRLRRATSRAVPIVRSSPKKLHTSVAIAPMSGPHKLEVIFPQFRFNRLSIKPGSATGIFPVPNALPRNQSEPPQSLKNQKQPPTTAPPANRPPKKRRRIDLDSPILTSAQMQAVEQAAFARGVEVEKLMDEAGNGVARAIRHFFPHPQRCIVFAGKGHNSGDALVAAEHLKRSGWKIDVRLAFPEEECGELTRKKLQSFCHAPDA